MCGIAGIQFKHEVAASVLDRAARHFKSSLAHRGPDAYGEHRTARAVFANLRLAIVDRSGGNQPIYAPERARGIVYNGEVYNWQELRRPLESSWPFTTHADTEAVLAVVLAEGDAGLARLNGMFGLCIWDDRDGSLLLARDRFGAKPLYVYEDAHCLAFASELQTLLSLEGLDHALDTVGFQDYLSYRYNLAPHTMFARIRKLQAGCRLRHANGSSELARYAEVSLHEPAATRRESEYIEELDGIMRRAVKSQLMGEVPIGVLLSGGLDSSAIAAYIHDAGARLKAYSIGFPEVNEFAFSRAVAQQFDLDYVEVAMTQGELREGMDSVIRQLDEPIADPACFALSRLCRRIKEDVTVVLSGEGGDEMFAGYQHHQIALHPALGPDVAFAHFFHLSANFADANQWLRDKSLPLQHLRYRPCFDRSDTVLNGMQRFELHTWMPENLMMKADKILMAHSLEGRFPFLDLDLWRFASTLPQSMKLPHGGSSKHVLRRLMGERLPRSVIERPKMGFSVPPAFFLQGLRERLLGAVDALRAMPVAGVLDLDAIQALVRRFYGGERIPVFKMWNIAVLLLWWADVYPALRARSQPAPAAAAARRHLVVYTVLVGPKEQLANPLALLPPGSTSDLELDFVCITDNPALKSDVWRIQLMAGGHVPSEKLSRRPKALPHEYFPHAEYSLYVDNTVSFKRLPQARDLETSRPYLFRAFRHASRANASQEAAAIVALGYDDVSTVFNQLDFYAARRPPGQAEQLTTATVLLRSHNADAVRRFGTIWWESILAFSKRDQLSFDFALREAGAEIEYFEGWTHDNPLLVWDGGITRKRVKASFDAKRYAWKHRDDADAQRDPKAHFLAHGGAGDEAYLAPGPLLEFFCHAKGSSLGTQVSPRRAMAATLEPILAAYRKAGARYLIVRVQGSLAPHAFDAAELDAAARALSLYLAPAAGAQIDLPAADLRADGKVYAIEGKSYPLVIVLGPAAEQLDAVMQKLHRLMDPRAGVFVAALTTPASVQQAVAGEAAFGAHFGARARATLQSSRHDDERAPLANTVLAIEWQRERAPAKPSPNAAAPARPTHHVLCEGGLCNRLNALIFALVLKRKFGHEWTISWPRTHWCGASFESLFTSTLPHDERTMEDYKAHEREHLMLMHENQIGFSEDRLVINRTLGSWEDYARLLDGGQSVVYHNSLLPNFATVGEVRDALQLLGLNADVAARASGFIAEHAIDASVVGMHIRKTDFGSLIDDAALFEQARATDRRVFVCSDDAEVSERFAALPNCSVFPKTAYPEKLEPDAAWQSWTEGADGRRFPFNVKRSADAVVEGLIDLLILSRTQTMLTSGSTFLHTARLFRVTGFFAPGPAPAIPTAAPVRPASIAP